MEKKNVDELREKVSCAALLEKDGWKVDLKESTQRAVKYRRGEGQIVIVIHEGRGWFDPLSDAKGDVFDLAQHLGADGFVAALSRVIDHLGYVPAEPEWTRTVRAAAPRPLDARWQSRPRLQRGSRCWRYLTEERALPPEVLQHAIRFDLLREGPQGSVWARHTDAVGATIGWEERGPVWRGFSTGGAKELFRLGDAAATRLAVTEAAIDAISLAAIEALRPDTLYLSTGGGWSPATEAALAVVAGRAGAELVGATDNNTQGESFAARLKAIAAAAGCDWSRLTPRTEDWNDVLKAKRSETRQEIARRLRSS